MNNFVIAYRNYNKKSWLVNDNTKYRLIEAPGRGQAKSTLLKIVGSPVYYWNLRVEGAYE